MQCQDHHNNVQFVLVNNQDQVVVQVDLADNVQVLLHAHNKVADNVQVLLRVLVEVVDLADNVQVVPVVQVADLHIVQVEPVAHQVVHQADLIVQVAHVQVLVVAEILRALSVRADQRRVITKRVRKLCVMILKTCKHLHLVA
jgi:hypothetical protein